MSVTATNSRLRFGDPVPNVKATLFVDFKVDPQSASSEKEKKAEKGKSGRRKNTYHRSVVRM